MTSTPSVTSDIPASSRAHTTDNPGAPAVTPRSRARSRARSRSRPGRLLAIVLTGQFMGVLDAFIVNVAAPDLRADLHTSGAVLQLVVAGYSIAYSVLLITGARLGARVGHGRMFLGGLALFTVASLACGLAQGSGQLIAFRLAQGTGAGLMLPQVLSLIQHTFTGTSRTRALGAYAAVLGVGAAAGQMLGGGLVSADLFGSGWRPVFLINVPIGVLLLAAGARVLGGRGAGGTAGTAGTAGADGADGADGGRASSRALDLPGLFLLAAAVLLFTVPVVLGQELDWPLWGWVSLLLCAVVFAVFVLYETRLSRRGGSPLLSPRVLRAPGVPLAVFRILTMMAVNGGFTFVLMLHLQGGLGQSALRAGLTVVPTCAAFSVAGLGWRRLPERWHPLLSPGGFLLGAASLTGIGALYAGGGDGGPLVYVLMATEGLGMSLAYNPVLAGAVARVRQEDAADASGLLVTTAQLGLLVGVAVFGAAFLGHAESGTGLSASAHAMALTCGAMAAAAVAGCLGGVVRALTRRRADL
ncbi:MFS transporter [Streptomyces sp. NPDC048172]|uniref:MFS transporter n=1 Tax=Streptomyces sp. NPDC048172 TaxID=3365505 RepID=UPI00371FFDF9